ncbi:DinB family protein [Halovulum sp. GXIMD14793]
MISVDYIRNFARYNTRQNQSLYREAGCLTDQERRQARGAYFKSIHRTLCHVLTADHIWMSRFDGWRMPPARGDKTPDWIVDWQAMCALRVDTDLKIITWADALKQSDLDRKPNAGGEAIAEPHWLLITHMFNHQTHHRGQVHAMLTGAGRHPDETDIELLI